MSLKRRAKYTRRVWTTEEKRLLRELYPNTLSAKIAEQLGRPLYHVHAAAQRYGLSKSAEFLASPESGRIHPGNDIGAATRFTAARGGWNKGLRRPGWYRGRMRETQFKPGHRPHTWKPIGSARVNADGYLDLKISDTGYPPRDWRGVHILTWEKANGPLPPGHGIVFRDGNKRNIALANLELVSRAELMRRNTIHVRIPEDLKRVIQLNGALKRRIREKGEKAHGQEQAVRSA